MKAFVILQDQANNEIIRLPLSPDSVEAVGKLVRLMPEPTSVQQPTPAPTPKPEHVFRPAFFKSRSPLYSASFIERAVDTWLRSDQSVQAVAAVVGVPHSTLDNWIRRRFGSADRSRVHVHVHTCA